jgi:RNA polymerase sigma factor (sigma-70 family)
MDRGAAGSVLREIRTLYTLGTMGGRTDAELLERFLARGEGDAEDAFATLVARHGPMVLGVCRRMLPASHDAEDAFQATFLVLARRAASIVRRERLASWLYGVAVRIAKVARRRAMRERAAERRLMAMSQVNSEPPEDRDDLIPILDEELNRPPHYYRAALLACELEGKSRREAAEQFGIPEGTLSTHLARGRKMLRERLQRRGVTLGVGPIAGLARPSAEAAVLERLIGPTVRAALVDPSGAGATAVVSAAVSSLAERVLKMMFLARLTSIVAALMMTAAAGAFTAVALGWSTTAAEPPNGDPLPDGTVARPGTRSAEAGPPRNQTAATVPPRQDKPVPPEPAARATVIGRVVDPKGQPVSGARLVLFTERRWVRDGDAGTPRHVPTARSDADGRFRVEFPLIPADNLERLYLEVDAPGFGFDGIDLKTDGSREEATVTMAPERIVEGRLVDVHGQPAAGVAVRVRELTLQRRGYGPGLPGDVPSWPAPVTTGPDGRFRLHGTSERAIITLEIDDPRFAHQSLVLAAGEEGRARPRTMPLLPPQVIDVRVRRGDDGKPMAGAWVGVQAGQESTGARTDDQGHVRISAWPGASYKIVAYPGDGEPYIRCETGLDWPKGAVQQSVEVKLRRGVILRGKVVEEPSGKPVAGAGISYYQTHRNNPMYVQSYNRDATSGPDGTFTLHVPHGPGHLLVQGPGDDYLHVTTSHGEMGTGWGPNLHMYPDALAHLDLPREETTHPVELRLRRGVTVRGSVIGPDGSPIAEAFAMGRTYVPYSRYRRSFAPFSGGGPQLRVREGRFEIPGCDPDTPSTFHFLDVKHQLGATVEISGKSAAAGPVTVQLQKCGSARVRFKDPDGKPVAGRKADEFPGMMSLIITPGAEFDAKPTNADFEFQVNLDPSRHWNLQTGPDGRATFVSLIPGARYRYRGHEFTADANRTIDLPDVTVPREKK